ncbi:MAG: glucan biosynthesis protein D [Deltaproteobacteria bacterium CG_4_8_14_3_um_filter_51_11]|nr:glucan biosynthesis protein G [bacterium]PIP47220.1 MAG: glucan biosynthesis protein D [Deltaproteobacteria bacterium CG23_combo_of_CG06-09_8_20_14_all_51_20]PIW00339.1 MAG: glucan biosynthesis protein D [Deltaproteobacteria bacterium CG17_big_fil_post_rev_8_21_14_2_50_51_6]PIX20530.1 MAG: glucan biosynthesis protein D [Deltaproteobacteria bacterium CG_4_8_14_3_um_filter_51_11]PIY26576.1 MAG: glucan biosynthesis protein D [Deltaproteobacteria bacterium CG_4_10_14_3_um_filter_51_14]PJB38738.
MIRPLRPRRRLKISALFSFLLAGAAMILPLGQALAALDGMDPTVEEFWESEIQAPFDLPDVESKARSLAAKPFQDTAGGVPDFLLKVSYDQWREIRFRPEKSQWREEELPFELQFFHPGLFYNKMVIINLVTEDGVRELPFSPDLFSYGENDFQQKVASAKLSFAGFRIHYPLNKPDYKDEVAVFLGASYFRAVGKGIQYGLSARGIALDTALPSGEEFPFFQEYWIVKPNASSKKLTVFALLNSPSCTGAYKFVIIPGPETVIIADCTIFLRKEVAKLGIAPLTSMFLYGETENGMPGDYRPEVHDSDGLLIRTSEGNYIWRPLANQRRLGVSTFKANNLQGFGLLQRDGVFDHYQDLEARYEMRPSLWIQPIGKWGNGQVELIEIPSEKEINDNIVAFYVPAKKVEVGPDGKPIPPKPDAIKEPKRFSYIMRWMKHQGKSVPVAEAVATRFAKGKTDRHKRTIVDFEGALINQLPADTGLSTEISVGEGARLVEKQLMKNEVTGGWRLAFEIMLDARDDLKSAFIDTSRVVKLSALLKKGDNIPDPLSVNWTYHLQP